MPRTLDTVCIDGDLLPLAEARIPVLDRGFLYGDAIYEVIAVYQRRAFLADRHIARLRRGLQAIGIDDPLAGAGWTALIERVIEANASCLPARAAVYLQVTRGDAPGRAPDFPHDVAPRVVAFCMDNPPPPARDHTDGISAVLLEDIRWRACNVKATSLLANVLAREEATRRGAGEALLHRNGCVLEGSSSNLLIWHAGGLASPPDGPDILPGVTRDFVLEQARVAGVRCTRESIPLDMLRAADEVWITSTTREVLPVTRIDGEPVGDGCPGPHWRSAHDRLQRSLTG